MDIRETLELNGIDMNELYELVDAEVTRQTGVRIADAYLLIHPLSYSAAQPIEMPNRRIARRSAYLGEIIRGNHPHWNPDVVVRIEPQSLAGPLGYRLARASPDGFTLACGIEYRGREVLIEVYQNGSTWSLAAPLLERGARRIPQSPDHRPAPGSIASQ